MSKRLQLINNNFKKSNILIFLLLWLAFFIPYSDFNYTIKEYRARRTAVVEQIDMSTHKAQISFALLFMFTFITAIQIGRINIDRYLNNSLSLFIIGFIIWISFSMIWSDNPFLTFRRVSFAVLLFMAAFAFALKFSSSYIIYFAFFSTFMNFVLALCAEIYHGTFFPFNTWYRFSGIQHPNILGVNLAITVISSWCLANILKKRRWIFIILGSTCFIFLILTKSRASLICALLGLSVYFLLKIPRKISIIIISQILLLFFGLLLMFPTSFVQIILLGRVEHVCTLTNRLPLWKTLIDYIGKRPFIGYGFNSFWSTNKNFKLYNIFGDFPFHSHNTYFELLLGAGIVGTLLYLYIFIKAMKESFKLYKLYKYPIYLYWLSILIFLLFLMNLGVILFMPKIIVFISLSIIAKLIIIAQNRNQNLLT